MSVAVTAGKLVSALTVSAARVKTLWDPLKSFLTFSLADDAISPARNVSVCIDRGSVSVAYGSRVLSRIRMKGIKTYPLEDRYPTPEGLASSVSMALSNLRVSKADMTLCIPKSWSVMKIAEFPCTVKDNLPDVISYEMDRLTPFTREEALYDFRTLKEEGGKLALMVVAAKANLINPYLDALAERDCNVTRVIMNLSGLGTLCYFSNKYADVLLFKISEKEYEAALFSGGLLTAARTGVLGTGDDKSHLDTISGEMALLMEEAKEKGNSPQVILSVRDCTPAFREMLKLRMNTSFKILEEGLGTFGLPAGEIHYEAVGGVIESLWPAAKGLNLLRRGQQEKTKTPLTLSVILAAAIFMIWAISIFMPVTVEENKLEQIQSEISSRKEEVKKVEALRKESEALQSEISALNGFKEARPMTLDLIKELTRILPKTTWLSRLRITGTTVEIEGYANSATELLPKLESSTYFKKVEFASPTFRDARMNLERFSIKMEIEGVKKDEAKQPEADKQQAIGKQPAAGKQPVAGKQPETSKQPDAGKQPAPARGGAVKK